MSDEVPPSFWDNATIFFFFLLLSGLLLLLNILRASSVKDSLTLVGFHFYMGLQRETSADLSPWTCPTCHPAEMQSLLLSPLPQLTLEEEAVWSLLSLVSFQSLMPQRQRRGH